jgi:hypothetical protein
MIGSKAEGWVETSSSSGIASGETCDERTARYLRQVAGIGISRHGRNAKALLVEKHIPGKEGRSRGQKKTDDGYHPVA